MGFGRKVHGAARCALASFATVSVILCIRLSDVSWRYLSSIHRIDKINQYFTFVDSTPCLLMVKLTCTLPGADDTCGRRKKGRKEEKGAVRLVVDIGCC